jgi:hypothetical protein
MLWRAILIWVVLAALLLLVFAVWIGVTRYEHGQNPSIAAILSYALHAPLFWLLAVILSVVAYFLSYR